MRKILFIFLVGLLIGCTGKEVSAPKIDIESGLQIREKDSYKDGKIKNNQDIFFITPDGVRCFFWDYNNAGEDEGDGEDICTDTEDWYLEQNIINTIYFNINNFYERGEFDYKPLKNSKEDPVTLCVLNNLRKYHNSDYALLFRLVEKNEDITFLFNWYLEKCS